MTGLMLLGGSATLVVGLMLLFFHLIDPPTSLEDFQSGHSMWKVIRIVVCLCASAAFFETAFQLYERAT